MGLQLQAICNQLHSTCGEVTNCVGLTPLSAGHRDYMTLESPREGTVDLVLARYGIE